MNDGVSLFVAQVAFSGRCRTGARHAGCPGVRAGVPARALNAWCGHSSGFGQPAAWSARIAPGTSDECAMGCRCFRSGTRPDIPLDVGSCQRAPACQGHGDGPAVGRRRRPRAPLVSPSSGGCAARRRAAPVIRDSPANGVRRIRYPPCGCRHVPLTETKGWGRTTGQWIGTGVTRRSGGWAVARHDAPCTNAWGIRPGITPLRRYRGRCGRTSSCSRAPCRCPGRCRAASSPCRPGRCSRGGCCPRDGSALRTARAGNRW